MAEMIMAFTPLVFLIVYALKTRKMAESMILATLLAMVLLHRQHFLTGTIDAMYATLANASYQFALCVIIGFGAMITPRRSGRCCWPGFCRWSCSWTNISTP